MKVLEITSSLDGGGIARLLYDYCSRLIPEFEFDFVVSAENEGILEEPLRNLGCNVFHVSQMKKSFGEYKRQLEFIIKNGNYDIVHDHCDYKSFFELQIAKRNGVKTRIAHSHRAMVPQSITEKFIKLIFTPLTKYLATDLFACGIDAAKWAWGKKAYENGKVFILKNAIHTEEFLFSNEIRQEIRNELGLTDKFVVGNVARFSYQKNHEYLIEIFKEIAKKRNDAVLVLVGRGELMNNVQEQVKNDQIDDRVIFLGVRNDVPKLLNAMDVFVLPSRYEGLPVALVEVQANGLPTYVSTAVTTEMKVSSNMHFISIDNDPSKWAKEILESDNKRLPSHIKESGYDIGSAVIALKEKYYSYGH